LKTFYKFFLVGCLIICSLLLVSIAYLHFGNLDPFRGKIESIATKSLGRQLSIDGHIDINLFPNPEVILNDISLANADWGSEPTMIQIGHIDTTINFMSIFSDLFIVQQLNISDVNVLLEQNEAGINNWEMSGKNSAEKSLPKPAKIDKQSVKTSRNLVQLPLMIDRTLLTGLTVKVRLPEQPEKSYSIEELSLKPGENGNFLLITRGKLDELPLILDGQITSIETLKRHEAVSLKLEGNFGDAHLKAEIGTTHLASLSDLQGQINITVEDIQQALKKVQIDSPIDGNLAVDISATKAANNSDMAVKAQAKLGTISVDGDAMFVKNSLNRANAEISVKDIKQIITLFNPDMNFRGPLTANIALIQESDKSGEVKIDIKTEGILADMNATLLDSSPTEVKINIDIKDINKTLKAAKIDKPLNGPLTAQAVVKKKGEAYNLKLSAAVDGLTADVSADQAGDHTTLNSTIGPLNRAGEIFEVKGIAANMLKLQASLNRSAEKEIELKDLQIEIGENRFKADGHFNLAGKSILKIDASISDLSSLLNTLPSTDFNAELTAEYSPEKIVLSPLAITFGKSDLNGDFTMLTGKKPNVKATLTSKILDLRPFTNNASPSSEAVKSKTSADEEGKVGKKKGRYVFKEEPLQLDQLQSIDADLHLSIDHFYSSQTDLKDWVLDGSLHDGNISAKTKMKSAHKGRATITLNLRTEEDNATIDTLVSLNDFGINALSKGISEDEIPATDVTFELKTSGKSPRELASAANGRILLTQGSGLINNSFISTYTNDVVAQLFNALNPFRDNEDGITQYDCTVFSVNIVDGLADIDGLLIQSEKLMIVGDGNINLKTEELNVEFNTKPRTGVGISAGMFVTPFIKVDGTLAEPSIGLSETSSLLSGGAAVATGGLSLLYKGVFDRVTAEGDQCAKTLDEVSKHANYTF